MGNFVCQGAMLQCSFGMAPSTLNVIVPLRPKCGNMLMANISDMVPMVNIMPFGMCQSMANPTVASATAATNTGPNFEPFVQTFLNNVTTDEATGSRYQNCHSSSSSSSIVGPYDSRLYFLSIAGLRRLSFSPIVNLGGM